MILEYVVLVYIVLVYVILVHVVLVYMVLVYVITCESSSVLLSSCAVLRFSLCDVREVLRAYRVIHVQ